MMFARVLVLLVFLVFLVSVVSSDDCVCGIPNANSKIIYGDKVTNNKYPWVVYLKMTLQDGIGACTGSIINDRFILTAAHCVENCEYNSDIEVFLTTSCNKKVTSSGKSLPVRAFKKHHLYNTVVGGYDIALIELENPLEFNDTFRPVCLYDGDNPSNLFVSGWGLTNFGFVLRESNCLLETQLKQVSNNECKAYGIVNPKYVMCAGERKTVCFGDSGGPMTTMEGAHVYQVGITSFTNHDCQILQHGPAAFERVKAHTEWIKERTKNAKWCSAPRQLINTIG